MKQIPESKLNASNVHKVGPSLESSMWRYHHGKWGSLTRNIFLGRYARQGTLTYMHCNSYNGSSRYPVPFQHDKGCRKGSGRFPCWRTSIRDLTQNLKIKVARWKDWQMEGSTCMISVLVEANFWNNCSHTRKRTQVLSAYGTARLKGAFGSWLQWNSR